MIYYDFSEFIQCTVVSNLNASAMTISSNHFNTSRRLLRIAGFCFFFLLVNSIAFKSVLTKLKFATGQSFPLFRKWIVSGFWGNMNSEISILLSSFTIYV